MKERPILFSGPMVRAILEDPKTQTRRVVKQQDVLDSLSDVGSWDGPGDEGKWVLSRCPYGQPGDTEWQTGKMPGNGYYYVKGLLAESIGGNSRAVWVNPEHFTFGFSEADDPEAIQLDTDITRENCQWKRAGDRLWVRETWQPDAPCNGTWPDTEFYGCKGAALSMIPDRYRKPEHCIYRATWKGSELIWRPSIHMPRWASRITLEITNVRVERLQDISEEDAKAEGCDNSKSEAAIEIGWYEKPKRAFRRLWEQINGAESWAANPWVWVIEFKVIDACKGDAHACN